MFDLAVGGTYTLTVYGNGRTTGDYAFAVDDVTTPPAVVAPVPGTPATVSGTLASGGSVDAYRIDATAGERLYFEGQADSPPYTVRYNLYDAFGNNILNNWAESDDSITLPRDGSYLLVVAGQDPTIPSPSYQFQVFEDVDPSTTINLGQTVSDTIANPGDQATYTFDAKAGQRIYFDALEPYVGGLNAVLTNPNGSTLFNYNAAYDEGVFDLAVGGTYTLTVYGNGRTTGDYAFRMIDAGGGAPDRAGGRDRDRRLGHPGQRGEGGLLHDPGGGRGSTRLRQPGHVAVLLGIRDALQSGDRLRLE